MENSVAVKNDELKKSTDDLVSRLVQEAEQADELTVDARSMSERCRDYYDNKQDTAEDLAVMKKRKQPPLVWNRIKRKVNFLTGYEIQQRMDPRAYPRNAPMDEQGADAATDALRYVHDIQMVPERLSDAYENGIVEGCGGVEVLYNIKTGCPEIKHIPWDRLYYDPFSSKYDFSDSTYFGIVVWMDLEQAKREYPDKVRELENTLEGEATLSASRTFDDKPRFNKWASTDRRKRVRICQHYYLEGGRWHWAHFTKGGLLKGGAVVPFLNEDQEPECPIIMWSCYKDRDNNRYGEVVELLDIQDEINKRRRKALYKLSVRQVKMDKGAVDRKESVRNELARPDGIIEVNPGRGFEILENTDQTSGELQLLQEAKNEMEFAGPNSSLMGDARAGASGRAIIASQQGGLSELGRVMARYRNFKLRVYRQIWNRVKQFWREEKWLRVTDDAKTVRFVGVNRPETVADKMIAELEAQNAPPEQIQQLQQQLAANPQQASQPTGKLLNNVAEMDVDIIIDETVDTITIQQEQFTQLVELAKSGIQIPPDALIEASSIRNKDKVLESMKSMQTPKTDPQAQDLQLRNMNAEIAEKETKAAKTAAETEKIQSETIKGHIEHNMRMAQPRPIDQNAGAYPA